MATIKLQVGGFSYVGGMAGTGGDKYDADDNGPESLAVYYRKQGLGAAIAKLGIQVFGRPVGKAYLKREEIDSLRQAGVELGQNEVMGAGMGNYVLWRVDH